MNCIADSCFSIWAYFRICRVNELYKALIVETEKARNEIEAAKILLSSETVSEEEKKKITKHLLNYFERTKPAVTLPYCNCFCCEYP